MSTGLEADFSSDEVFISRFPIHRACRDGDVGALMSLLEQLSNQAHLTTEDSRYGWTPMHWAAYCGQLECVVHLAQMGCEVNMVTSRFNQTPTHTAAFGGHPHCVVWLTQAGADIDKQDFLGEAPIHKAARSGSLECIQVLLIAGAKPHLRNASGQTAADLAQAHGFHDCFCLISDDQKHLHQQSENSLFSRKRQLAATDARHMKKARRADRVMVQMQSSTGEEVESMNVEFAQEHSSDDNAKAVPNRHHHKPPCNQDDPKLPQSTRPPSPPVAGSRQMATASPQRPSAEMCGSLHLTNSSGSCVSHPPAWWGIMGADCGDFLHYGHYHGFGDTAEELSDGSRPEYSSIQAEHGYKKGVASIVHL
ncbi:ankyrin repeat domain-containing protein 10-like isoform X2 [Mugil cephalus]|uniref:ankyrin repeat domain-containing protein 10-like isoform X2 n=1 Tax=Mugil cephalus TaxID=48193 RepID=UPI001FB6DFDD|nr:ankyrin repeat domain-containing protein 10-like isoform X2 [Mugil cephalus]